MYYWLNYIDIENILLYLLLRKNISDQKHTILQVVLWSSGYASLAPLVPQSWRLEPLVHGEEDHAPLPLPQHLPPPDPVREGADAGGGE